MYFRKANNVIVLHFQLSRRYPKGKTPADPTSNRSNDETEPNPKVNRSGFSFS